MTIEAHFPAFGPRLRSSIEQAISVAEKSSRSASMSSAQEDLNLWLALLNQSHAGIRDNTTPLILKGDLASPLGISLTGRRWARFERWFQRHQASSLLLESTKSGIPAIYGARISNKRGGRAEHNEACYYLTYSPPDSVGYTEWKLAHQRRRFDRKRFYKFLYVILPSASILIFVFWKLVSCVL